MEMYKPYEYNKKTLLLERHLLIGVVDCTPDEYDIFDFNIAPEIKKEIQSINKETYENYDVFEITNPSQYGDFLNRKQFPNIENKKIYFYTEIDSNTDDKILISILNAINSKYWLNGECIHINKLSSETLDYMTSSLRKGKNYLLVELFSPARSVIFTFQVKNYEFEMSDDYQAIVNLGNTIKIDQPVLIESEYDYTNNDCYKFMFFSPNKVYKDEFEITIFDDNDITSESLDTPIIKMNGHFNDIISIDIEPIKESFKSNFGILVLKIMYEKQSGEAMHYQMYYYLNNNENALLAVLNDVKNKSLELLSKIDTIHEENLTAVLEAYEDSIKNGQLLQAYKYGKYLCKYNNEIIDGSYKNKFYNRGYHQIFIKSILDGNMVAINAKIPDNYDSNYNYPVIMIMPISHNVTLTNMPLEENVDEPCLFFDVTARGKNGGSYIGEASLIELINWIKQNYSIDKDRIYIIGQCSGGYTAYSFAQNHPHIPAAIFPPGARANMRCINNITNIPTYQLACKNDDAFHKGLNEITSRIGIYGNYYQYNFKNMSHQNLGDYLLHKEILSNMLNHRKNKYPDNIMYRTIRNRHLRSFWVDLHGIAKDKKEAYVHAQVINENLIEIQVSGANGITVEMPPRIDRKQFMVIINKYKFRFSNYKSNQIIFSKKIKWNIINETPIIDYRKGTGLLDVYMDSMRIIIPSSNNEIMKKIACNFSRPVSNAGNPEIYINYPIYTDNDMPDDIFKHNQIWIDDLNNSHVKKYMNYLKVKYDHTGYSYKNKMYNGDYVIMQVIPNPYDNKKTILIISTNNENLLSRNLFTRKIVIPFYVFGTHMYLNSEVLIFDGKKYTSIYEENAELIEI